MSLGQAAAWGLTSFRAIVAEVWALKDLRNFLIAFFFYIDGVLTIIGMAGPVAKLAVPFATPTRRILGSAGRLDATPASTTMTWRRSFTYATMRRHSYSSLATANSKCSDATKKPLTYGA